MIASAALPTMTFIAADGSQEEVDLAARAPEVNTRAAHLRGLQAPGDVVGLIGHTTPDLVLSWLAALVAGLRPMILQYPTKKQSRAYWSASVANSVEIAQIAALIVDDAVAEACPDTARVVRQSTLTALELPPEGPARAAISSYNVRDFSILQLSSGTTGHRKAMEFTSTALSHHVHDYNRILELDSERDTIVSWLPLYHDMGYVACFVMPVMLGIPVVITDPMTWVGAPGMLYDAITRHKGTICYMPNFGYEIMARQALKAEHNLSSMRWWISCSEPVSAATCRRFTAHIGAPEEAIAPCYAMAENIFAMTIRRGIDTRQVAGIEAVSNGRPIPGVEVDIREGGQIWVRSPASLTSYVGGASIADEKGFYPTGDLGALDGGELYIAGRTQDLVIQAGRKYMLSDIDLIVNRLMPEVKGRAVACQDYDERLATQTVRVLIEDPAFYARTDGPRLTKALQAETSLDQISVNFVPPRFLTKTSSGKFNRKTSLSDWRLAQAGVSGGRTDPVAEMKEAFKTADWSAPVSEVLDSLSSTVLRILVADAGFAYEPDKSLSEISAQMNSHFSSVEDVAEKAAEEVIHIVSIAERSTTVTLTPAALAEIGARIGKRVTFQHLCMPPSAVTLSDLIFHRWFQPRVDGPDYAAVTRAFDILSKASLIITDDIAEMYFPPHQVYGALSHRLERDPRVDLVAVRWQRYPQFHDKLPLTTVSGADLPLKNSSKNLQALSAVLKVPIFRIATMMDFSPFTEGWEFRAFQNRAGTAGGGTAFAPEALTLALADWCAKADTAGALKPSPIQQVAAVRSDDLAHFCSHYTNQVHLDKVLDAFGSFLIAGQSASVPYIQHRLEAEKKPFQILPTYAEEAVEQAEPAEVILICGAQGRYETTLPTVAVMKADPAWENRNLRDAELRAGSCYGLISDLPETGDDWYYPHEKIRFAEYDAYRSARQAAGQQAQTIRLERIKRRARMAAGAEGEGLNGATGQKKATMAKPDPLSPSKPSAFRKAAAAQRLGL